MAELIVDTFSVLHSEAGIILFGPRLDPDKLLQGPLDTGSKTEVTQVVVYRRQDNPKFFGSLYAPVVHGYLEGSDFDRLQAALQQRKAGSGPVRFQWQVGHEDSLTSFTYQL